MARPKHIRSDGQYYFVTTGTHRRAPIFGRPDLAEVVIDALYHIRRDGRIGIHGFVVMPDHFHVVISLVGDNTLPRVMHSLKSYSANAINRTRGSSGGVWQEGYYDYALRNVKDAERKLRYVLGNPLRKRLAEEFDLYPWSSANEAYEVDPL